MDASAEPETQPSQEVEAELKTTVTSGENNSTQESNWEENSAIEPNQEGVEVLKSSKKQSPDPEDKQDAGPNNENGVSNGHHNGTNGVNHNNEATEQDSPEENQRIEYAEVTDVEDNQKEDMVNNEVVDQPDANTEANKASEDHSSNEEEAHNTESPTEESLVQAVQPAEKGGLISDSLETEGCIEEPNSENNKETDENTTDSEQKVDHDSDTAPLVSEASNSSATIKSNENQSQEVETEPLEEPADAAPLETEASNSVIVKSDENQSKEVDTEPLEEQAAQSKEAATLMENVVKEKDLKIVEVKVKVDKETEENVECVLENVAVEGQEQVYNVIGDVQDPMEENLESFAPVKEEKQPEPDANEQVLVDDEEMVVTQITSIGELVQQEDTNGHTQVIVPPPIVPIGQQFTEIEDLVIHALDTISPFDAKFISEYLANRDESQIERRLTDHDFRKRSFTFQKLPFLMFELVFVNDNERSRSLMLLTQKQMIQLRCKNPWANKIPGIESIEMHHNTKNKFGIDTGGLCEFIITNIPNMHMPYLRRNVREIEAFMEASGINFRRENKKKDLKHILNRIQPEITMDSLRLEGMPLIKIDEVGQLHLKEEHEQMLIKIVMAVGRNNWEEVTKLLIAVFEYEVDVDMDDDEIYEKFRMYFETKLDPDLQSGPFTMDEDKCVIFMYKYFSKVFDEDDVWKHIARHLDGRTANQVKNRFQRSTNCPTDMTLENILKYPDDPTNPATFNNDLAHIFALTVVKKNLAPDMELTTKLQHEDSFLVMGTRQELFILASKDTSIKYQYPGIVAHTFTYDPDRPPQQFLTFVKLTFANGLKKLGLLDDPETFNFNNIDYRGDTIHDIINLADQNR